MWVIWVDAGAAALGIVFLAVVSLTLYRRIKHFNGVIKQANSQISELTSELEKAQANRTRPSS